MRARRKRFCGGGLAAGVDEAGRGPLAGPVVVAACILGDDHDWSAVNDSKVLDPQVRAELAAEIKACALAWRICLVSSLEVDRLNILQATLFGMTQCVRGLSLRPLEVLVDGNRLPAHLDVPARAVIGGDGLEKCIGAASILAKVERDAYMVALDQRYPGYEFAANKGYGTPGHLHGLRRLGPTPEHRRSFAPVRECLQGSLFA